MKSAPSPMPNLDIRPATPRSGKLEPLQFVQEKIAMKKMVAQVLTSGEGSRSVHGRLESLIKKVDAEEMSTMDEDPNNTKTELQNLDNNLREKVGQVDKVRASDWPTFQAELQRMADATKDRRIAAEALLKALDFSAKQHTKVKKSADNSVRYKRDRWAERLHLAGFPEELARRLSKRPEIEKCIQAESLTINPERAELHKPVMWTYDKPMLDDGGNITAAHKLGHDFMDKLMGIKGGIKNIADKQENLTKFLVDNAHGGTMSRLDGSVEAFASLPPFAGAALLNLAGAAPWLNVTRPWSWRWGPSVFPLPGMGGLIMPLPSSNVEFKFLVVPASVVLATGVPLRDLHTFWDTPSGLDIAANTHGDHHGHRELRLVGPLRLDLLAARMSHRREG